MENQRPDDPAKSVTPGGRQAVPCVCIADADHSMRTFLAETLEGLGFTSCACTQATELARCSISRRPDLVVIGSSPGGIEACEMLELLAAREFDGKVLVLGHRVSPMVAAIQQLGAKLGLAMLPLLPTPFGDADVRGCVATLMPVAPPPEAPGATRPRPCARTGSNFGTNRRSTRARSRWAVSRRSFACAIRPAGPSGRNVSYGTTANPRSAR